MGKNVLLIAGGGTLGTYTAEELLRLGHRVEVICLEEKTSNDENLCFYQRRADAAFLEQFLQDKKYDGIVNFIHYPHVEEYPAVHQILMAHTDHLIVLSSYRVYADEQHPITEEAPMLLDTSTDPTFLETEKYALSKAKLERYLQAECKGQNWTVVRPVISFSSLRLDLVTYSGHMLLEKARNGETIPLPVEAKDRTAGLDWAGNSGKLIANLLFKQECIGQAYTVSSAQNLTWGQLAELYSELIGAKFAWVPLEAYCEAMGNGDLYWLIYDRLFDRKIDNSKICKATGLKETDFVPIKEGLKRELTKIKEQAL
jgi:nucleoside-diphosphate-sugar epimerase